MKMDKEAKEKFIQSVQNVRAAIWKAEEKQTFGSSAEDLHKAVVLLNTMYAEIASMQEPE